MTSSRIWRLLLTALALCLALPLLSACGDDGGGASPEGEDEARVTTILPEGYARVGAARFAPQDQTLAMVAETADGAEHLILSDLEGGSVQVLVTEGVSYLTTIAWEPDGQSLLYSGGSGIMRVDTAQGSEPEEVVGAFAVSHIDLSPDGSTLAWGVNGSPELNLATLGPEGVATDVGQGPEGSAPRFGPDGAQIVYMAGGQDTAFALIDAALEGEPMALPGKGSYLSNGAWVDGDTLLLLADEKVQQVQISTGAITDLREAFAATGLDVSPDGRHYVYGTNGSSSLTLVER